MLYTNENIHITSYYQISHEHPVAEAFYLVGK